MSWCCYVLQEQIGERTYVGATVDPARRLRQHNGEITGGARATSGRKWNRICYVRGFPDNHAALKFEWRWKYYGRKYDKSGGTPIERRLRSMNRLLAEAPWDDMGLEIVWNNIVTATAGEHPPENDRST
jgi:predicted GIY-YIG superfamily endonuclease